MLPFRLKATLLVILVIGLFSILSLLKRRRLALKYTLLWLLTLLALFIVVLNPGLLTALGAMLGIRNTMNALYVFMIAFMLIILLSLTSIVSRQTERIKRLAEENALLEKRVRDMEKGSK